MPALLLSLLAALGYGLSDFVGGMAARKVAVLRVVVVSYPVGLLGMALIAPIVGGTVTTGAIVYGALSGIAGGLAILWFYEALASGPMSVVSPLTSLLVAALPLGVGMLWGERPGLIALLGAGLAVIAVVMVSRAVSEEGSTVRFTPKVAWLTFGSGAAFAVYFVLLDKVGDNTGLWPLLISRGSATLLVVVAAGFTGNLKLPGGVSLKLAVTAGLLDVLANVAFLYALRAGLLSLVSVLTSLYPAATVLLASIVLRERIVTVQRVGLVLAAIAVAMIAGASATG